ncbi:MAG: 7-cyano-7-deazaguanine synthase [Planctomycetota bacterium]
MSDLWHCSVTLHGKNEPVRKELLGGRHFRLDTNAIPQFTCRNVPKRSRDLLRLASAVYAADRIVARDRRSGDDGWTRRLTVEIEVEDCGFWQRSSAAELLTECLDFLTGDVWEFRFLDGPVGGNIPHQKHLEFETASSSPPVVCLYSGGLDSAAGLVHRLTSEPKNEYQPVTVWHRSGLRRTVLRQLKTVGERSGVRLSPLIAKYAMVRPSRLGNEETTQRSRSFLFSTVGAVVASVLGASRVEVYESGIGAVNLPLQTGMVGSRATRSCHPYFFRTFSRLLPEVFGQPVEFVLPFVDCTKGEVVKVLAEAGLEDCARSTISCVHYPLRDERFKRCGLCPACLFRRVALSSAGIREAENTYKWDVFRDDANSLPQDRLRFLKAFLIQISSLSELDTPGKVPRQLSRHFYGTKALASGESVDSFVDVYRRYRQEWLSVIARGRAMNMDWAQLLSPESVLA